MTASTMWKILLGNSSENCDYIPLMKGVIRIGTIDTARVVCNPALLTTICTR